MNLDHDAWRRRNVRTPHGSRLTAAAALAAAIVTAAVAPAAWASPTAQSSGRGSPAAGSPGTRDDGASSKDDGNSKDDKASRRPSRGAKQRQAAGDPATNARLQLRLDPEDRQALDRALLYSLPEIPTEGAEWIGGGPLTTAQLRGRVVVIQSVSVRSGWRGLVDGLRRQLDGFDDAAPADTPVVLLLHTPDGADKAKAALGPILDGWLGVVDADGSWCDALGVWKKPVNLVVDRNGIVRYAGLTPPGVRAAVDILLAEQADPSAAPRVREEEQATEVATFPTFREPVGQAADRRGQSMPALQVTNWITAAPDPGRRLVLIDFWFTGCAPCRAAIPHLNDLAQRYGEDLCIVGLSGESRSNFEEGCRKHDLKERDFRYAVALDSQKRLESFFGVRAFPHCAVISSDGIVRWQGLPSGLTDDVVQSLIAANRALATAPRNTGAPRSWKDAKESAGRGRTGASAPRRGGY